MTADIPFAVLSEPHVWGIDSAHALMSQDAPSMARRTSERRLHDAGILAPELNAQALRDEWGRPPVAQVLTQRLAQARARRDRVFFAQLHRPPHGPWAVHFNDGRGGRLWRPLESELPSPALLAQTLDEVRTHLGKDITVFPHGQLAALCRSLDAATPVDLLAYPCKAQPQQLARGRNGEELPPHLASLEAESIHILREAVAEAQAPVMLY